MDYVEWVEEVMAAVAAAWKEAEASKKLVGLHFADILSTLGFPGGMQAVESERPKLVEALRDALVDLCAMGLLESQNPRYKVTHEGSKYPVATLATAWPGILEVYVDDEQRTFLEAVADIGQETYDGFACVKDLTGQQVFHRLGWAWDSEGTAKCYVLAMQLSDIGMLRHRPYMGGHIDINPAYVGIVRVTRQTETELGKVIRNCLAEWETTTVDFKRLLNLKRDKEKAEFVRDVLGLATTKSSGRRFLIIGFDDKTREFYQSVDTGVSQERAEQILQAYCEPAPGIRYHRVPWAGGEVGLFEVFRDAQNVPYKVTKALGGKDGIQKDDVYVRHGSHTEPPTQRELDDLIGEGIRARSV